MRYVLVPLLVLLVVGCGRRREREATPLQFEEIADTSRLSKGDALLAGITPYRSADGALRVRGNLRFPDGTRLQISIYRKGTQELVSRIQTIVEHHRFETPPLRSAHGPVPPGDYRFEYFTLFNPVWQSAEVLRATADGRALRGPGVGRDRVGGASFYLVEERSL